MHGLTIRKSTICSPIVRYRSACRCLGVAVNVRSIVNASIKQWNTELTTSKLRLGNVKIKRGIFQGDSLSPLLFVLVMIPLTFVVRLTKASYEVKKGGKKINDLLFMDDLKLFAKKRRSNR